eukprot:g1657.t1
MRSPHDEHVGVTPNHEKGISASSDGVPISGISSGSFVWGILRLWLLGHLFLLYLQCLNGIIGALTPRA